MGQSLCSEVESIVKAWGYSEVLLLVEEQNTPANKLYEKLGYTERWLNPSGVAMRIEGPELVEKEAATRAMVKSLE